MAITQHLTPFLAHRGWLLLSIIALFLAGLLLGRGFWLLPWLQPSPEISAPALSVPTWGNEPPKAIQKTALFSGKVADGLEQTDIVDSNLPLDVKGLMAGTRPPMAMLVYQGEMRLVREGERLDDTLRVVRIDPDTLLLLNHGQIERLRFGVVDESLFAPSAELPAQAFMQDTRLDAYRRAELLDDVRLVAVIEQGRVAGYKFSAQGQSVAFFQLLGLESGDRLQRVNGGDVAGMETLNKMLEQLAQGQQVDVEVLRAGQVQQLTLTLKEKV